MARTSGGPGADNQGGRGPHRVEQLGFTRAKIEFNYSETIPFQSEEIKCKAFGHTCTGGARIGMVGYAKKCRPSSSSTSGPCDPVMWNRAGGISVNVLGAILLMLLSVRLYKHHHGERVNGHPHPRPQTSPPLNDGNDGDDVMVLWSGYLGCELAILWVENTATPNVHPCRGQWQLWFAVTDWLTSARIPSPNMPSTDAIGLTWHYLELAKYDFYENDIHLPEPRKALTGTIIIRPNKLTYCKPPAPSSSPSF